MVGDMSLIRDSQDEYFYSLAIEELKSGSFSQALWDKALAKSNFDETQAKGEYVELRVEQFKDEMLEGVENEIKIEDMQVRLDDYKNDIEEIETLKSRTLFANIFSNPLFIIEVLVVASLVGMKYGSWWYFVGVIFALTITMIIPKLNYLVSVGLAGFFGMAAYQYGAEWWGETGGYWFGGIIFLVMIGVNIEIITKNKEVSDVVHKHKKELSEMRMDLSHIKSDNTSSENAGVSSVSLVLVDPGKHKIRAIKCVRELTGCGLRTGKDLVENAPSTILENITEDEAVMAIAFFEEDGVEGANLEIKPTV